MTNLYEDIVAAYCNAAQANGASESYAEYAHTQVSDKLTDMLVAFRRKINDGAADDAAGDAAGDAANDAANDAADDAADDAAGDGESEYLLTNADENFITRVCAKLKKDLREARDLGDDFESAYSAAEDLSDQIRTYLETLA